MTQLSLPLVTTLLGFPVPFPDEPLYSLLARYHLGSGSAFVTIKRVFGRRGVVPTNALPWGLDAIASNLPPGHPSTADSLLLQHTLYPYFSPFLRAETASKMRALMLASEPEASSKLRFLLGLPAGKILLPHVPRFCDQCAADDVRRHGQPYWHRVHQAPGVVVCPAHDASLRTRVRAAEKAGRHELYLPPLTPTASCVVLDGQAIGLRPREILARVARLTQALVNGDLPQNLRAALATAYRRKLTSEGAITPAGSVRRLRFNAMFEPVTANLRALPDFAFLTGNNTATWAARTGSDGLATGHPLKHIFTLAILYDDLDALRVALATSMKECAPPVSLTDESERWIDRLPALLADGRTSMRAVAQALHKTTTTVRIHAERLGLSVRKRPKSIDAAREKEIVAMLERGNSPKCVAADIGTSLSSVYRVRATHPRVAEATKSSAFEARRTRCREWLRRVLQRDESVSLDAVRAHRHGVWLHKHDRAHLVAHVRPSTATDARQVREAALWAKRDETIAAEVKVSLAVDPQPSDKPVRRTMTTILRMSHAPSFVAKNLGRLPTVQATIAAACETDAQFRLRRARWAIEQLSRRGDTPKVWNVKRVAGIGKADAQTDATILVAIAQQEDVPSKTSAAARIV